MKARIRLPERNPLKRVILLPLLSLAVFAPTAAAVEETGRGEAIEHVKNIAYPNLNARTR